MAQAAASFLFSDGSPTRLAREVARLRAQVGDAGGALLFLSGDLATQLAEVARELAPALAGVPALLVSAAGVLSEAGQVEGGTAASGVLWRGGRAQTLCVSDPDAEACASALAGQIHDRAARSDHASLLFLGPDLAEHLTVFGRDGRGHRIFGAGVPHASGVAVVHGDGRVEQGQAAAMVLVGLHPPKVQSAPACRVLGEPKPITLARGPLVLELGGEPALDALGRVAEGVRDQSLLLAAVFEAGAGPEGDYSIQPIRGVDPSRGGVVLPRSLPEGTPLGFAVRDADTAREELTRTAFGVKRELGGALPTFGLLLSCAGRGAGLYGREEFEVNLLKRTFPRMPLAGMMSAFELPPTAHGPELALFTAITAVFSSPS
ncbi:MAG: FIST C-terminal domain-containing protein [Polyangiaceae bacterium]